MSLIDYIRDKWYMVSVYLFSSILSFLILYAANVQRPIIIIVQVIYFLSGIVIILISYYRKKDFYQTIQDHLDLLDKKYLVLELIPEPTTYEEEIIYQILFDINKSMIENIKEKEMNIKDFKEYIELWIHEVKIPISSLVLKCHNNKEKYTADFIEQIRRLDNYIDQVLYYVRSENTEKDFMISEVNLKTAIRNTILKNKDDLLDQHISIYVDDFSYIVDSDKKWIEFIMNQIVNNAIKYKKDNAEIKISAYQKDQCVTLSIYDNGIGIPRKDIKHVFEKSFTGSNGRDKTKSTGMGLYIVKNLCDKLGHKIEIESKENEFTCVKIHFYKNQFYKY